MEQEEKNLLIKDLCGRLPYGVIVHHKNVNQDFNVIAVFNDGRIGVTTLKENIGLTPTSIDVCKPYLRPMSSMSEKEREIYDSMFIEIDGSRCALFPTALIEWLNAHHFDYRGLIEKGLALEAQEGMYKN